MAPNSVSTIAGEQHLEQDLPKKEKFERKIVWFNVIMFLYLHLGFVYGVYLIFTSALISTCVFTLMYGNLGGLGITAGSHRLWAHRSYKAKWPLRLFLIICTSIAGQNDVYEWARDHRVHHKFTETNADPHNIKRGFFFAHMGWLMCKKHPDVITKGKEVFVDDIWADPLVRMHRRFYIPMLLLFSFYIPTMMPVWLFGESVWNSFFLNCFGRYCYSLHVTWLVNSVAHTFGDKPFNKYIEARENPIVALFSLGEGWHNYHHVFPWDYATSELGYTVNFTKLFIDAMAYLGLAYDLKTVTKDSIIYRKHKTGDGTRYHPEDEVNESFGKS